MASIRQYQRRAIEQLVFEDYLPDGIETQNIFLEGGNPLFILGVSRGRGTCSDMRGVDVLVLSERSSYEHRVDGVVQCCRCSVLLRRATQDEYAQQGICSASQLLMCIEGLRFTHQRNGVSTFVLSQSRAYYISTC